MLDIEIVGQTTMVINVELAKKVQDQEQENRQLKDTLIELEAKLG